MELSKHVPAKFEVGDVVMLSGDEPTHKWLSEYIGKLVVVTSIDWRWETLHIKDLQGARDKCDFKHFKLIKKNSNPLVKLII